MQRLQSLDRLLPFAGSLLGAVMNEARGIEGDKIFKTVIPRTVRLSEAPSFGKTIFDYDPLSPGATAYKNLAKELISRFGLNGK